MIKNINVSNVDLSTLNAGVSKAWDGCLQARTINVLHSIYISDYYNYYYNYYDYCCCCCCCYIQLRQAAIIKRALIGLSYVARAGQII